MKITRRTLIGSSVNALLASYVGASALKEGRALAGSRSHSQENFYRRLVRANDERLATVTAAVSAATPRRTGVRRVAYDLQSLVAAFCAPESSFFQAESLVAPMEKASRFLLDVQHRDGTIDAGNLQSPPDMGFVVEAVSAALAVLRKSGSARLERIKDTLARFLRAAGEPLVTGGVHTPNHRWVVCSALAQLNSLFPSAKYVERINDWLGEEIDIDADGQYSERSTGIYSQVTDAALITMARLLGRPELLEPVRKNLETTLYYIHPDGEIETVGSRRQDQFMVRSASVYYLDYRYLAIKDRNRVFAGVVKLIEEQEGAAQQLVGSLIYLLEEPLLREEIPESVPFPSDYAKVFPRSSLARIRRGRVSASIYGGSDWPSGVASGLASNPTFFTFRKGKAVLESVRLGASFFSKGVFRSTGWSVVGNQYVLVDCLTSFST